MIVLVCGGRDYADRARVKEVLDLWHRKDEGITVLIEGGAAGADRLAAEWAESHGVHSARVKALWETAGRSAGPRRNRAMLALNPHVVVAFPGGKGTADMCKQAAAKGVPVRMVEPAEDWLS